MNLVLFEKDHIVKGDDSKGIVRLDGRIFGHLNDVLRLDTGDSFKIGLINGKIGQGKILRFFENYLEAEYFLDVIPEKKLPLTLIVSYPRPKTLKKVLQYSASLGVNKIIIVNSFRVDKSYWKNPILNDQNIRKELLLGLEQSVDTELPEIEIKRRFKPFIEDELKDLVKGKRAILAHPDALVSREEVFNKEKEETVLFIGPEGGLIDYEVKNLKSIGFRKFSFGKRILRVEVAVVYSISKLF